MRRLRGARRAAFGASVLVCEGGWYAVLATNAPSDEALALSLLERHDVIVHPGYLFDFEGDGHLVLSLIARPEAFEEGIAALRMIPD